MIAILGILFGAFLAFSNGANDNFKGVGTVYGSKIASYRTSLGWATITTFIGSVFAFLLAAELLKNFSGKGLVPDEIFQSKLFPLSVTFGAAATVFLASRLGFPVSTTHAITGALVGAGLTSQVGAVNFSKLGSLFLYPLLLSPVISVLLTVIVFFALRFFQDAKTETANDCLCVKPAAMSVHAAASAAYAVPGEIRPVQIITGKSSDAECAESTVKLTSQRLVRATHFLSSGLVSFARGLNDTPKIAALLLTTGALGDRFTLVVVGLFIALGGLLYSRRVAETVSHKITDMTQSQGLVANIITALMVFFASRFGMPVSTTHVSTGAIFGIGAVSGKMRWNTVMTILLAWLITMPLAAGFSAAAFLVLTRIA